MSTLDCSSLGIIWVISPKICVFIVFYIFIHTKNIYFEDHLHFCTVTIFASFLLVMQDEWFVL